MPLGLSAAAAEFTPHWLPLTTPSLRRQSLDCSPPNPPPLLEVLDSPTAAWDPSDAQQQEDWQQQVEEVVALHAILEDAFLLLGGLPEGALEGNALYPADLAGTGPAGGSSLEYQVAVYVDVPAEGLRLQVGDDSAVTSDCSEAGAVTPELGSGVAHVAQPGPVVQHLPPVCLRLRFPRDYPSASRPQVLGLSALWLSAADSAALRRHLAALWKDQGPGSPVCYAWVEALQSRALSELGYTDSIPLVSVAASRQLQAPPPISTASQQPQASLPAASAAQELPPPPPRAAQTLGGDIHRTCGPSQQRAAPSSSNSSSSQGAVPFYPIRGVSPARLSVGGSSSGLAAAGGQHGAAAAADSVLLPNRQLRGRRRSVTSHSASDSAPSADLEHPLHGSALREAGVAQGFQAPPDAAREAAAAAPEEQDLNPGSLPQAAAQAQSKRAGEEVMVQLLMFNAVREAQLFSKGTWPCGVCFEEALGRDCVRLVGCGHIFCAGCVGEHCRLHVREGSVARLTCLAFKCTAELPHQVLARVLSPGEMERCEELALARALDRMPDLVYCPRCEDPTIEDGEHCAQCSKCYFAFCSLCNESWHPGSVCVSLETQLAIVRQRLAGRRDDVEALRRKEGEMMSLARIKETAKQCPSCSMAIVKSEGCNKMTCTYCGAWFCFRCLKVVSGYDHFQGACILFDDAEVQRWNLQFEAERQLLGQYQQGAEGVEGGEAPRWNHRRCACPQCGTANWKQADNNNHMSCWACATPFCFLCRANLRREGGRHFGRGPPKCRQHTAEG